jgi:hypothetical protein
MRQKLILFSVVLVGALAISLCTKPTSEDKMLSLLEESKHRAFNHENNFCPEAQLPYLDSMLKAIPESEEAQRFRIKHFKANVLLQLGRPDDAIHVLRDLERNPGPFSVFPGILRKVTDDMAVACLRFGEQINCINNHSVDACILPIKNGGIHRNTKGSRGTVDIYKRLLSEKPDDFEALWLLNIAYMTLGQYPSRVPKAMLIPGMDLPDPVAVKPFQDIAPDLKLDVRNMAGGAITEDFDNDGFLDLATSGWDLSEPMHYFKNNGDGTFSDKSEQSRLSKFTGGLHMTQTDYNNDGFKDIFVLRGAWLSGQFGEQPNSLLRNNGDGTFTDVTIESGLLSMHPTQTATWNDFNNDGWLDVFIGNETTIGANYHPCELYLNNKNGTFREVAKQSKVDVAAFVKGVTSGDYDNDGWNDLFVSTLSGRRFLLRNKGGNGADVSFEDVTQAAALDKDQNRSFATWFWDYDNDGWQDIVSCDYTMDHNLSYYAAAERIGKSPEFHGQPVLYHNNHDGTFSNVTKETGLDKTSFAMGGNFGDIDNDGYLDIFVGTGNPSYKSLIPNKMFKNIDGKSFADVTTSAQVGSLQKGHAVAFADMDNDGDQDIYIEMGGAYIGDAYQSSFFMNPGQSDNNWVSIDLEGVKANKASVGSKIKLTFTENGKTRSVYRTVTAGGSFGSAPFKREIGIGQARMIDEVEIRWNGSGTVQKFRGVAANQFLKVREGAGLEKVSAKKLTFVRDHKHEMPVCLPVAKAQI